MDRVPSECSAAVAHGTSRAVHAARQEVQGREVPHPLCWTGFRVCPSAIEFWTHRAHRLHDREIYFRRGRG
jgi:pyridoxamine 5'-phosphate oxidase